MAKLTSKSKRYPSRKKMVEELSSIFAEAEVDDNPYEFIKNALMYGVGGFKKYSLDQVKDLYDLHIRGE